MSTGAAAPKEPTVHSEEDEVFRWRAEQFRQLGFNEGEARDLAVSRADLGQARYLVQAAEARLGPRGLRCRRRADVRLALPRQAAPAPTP